MTLKSGRGTKQYWKGSIKMKFLLKELHKWLTTTTTKKGKTIRAIKWSIIKCKTALCSLSPSNTLQTHSIFHALSLLYAATIHLLYTGQQSGEKKDNLQFTFLTYLWPTHKVKVTKPRLPGKIWLCWNCVQEKATWKFLSDWETYQLSPLNTHKTKVLECMDMIQLTTIQSFNTIQ